jgi:hypothetical protein
MLNVSLSNVSDNVKKNKKNKALTGVLGLFIIFAAS